jgi:hypothetical protein
MQHRSALRLDPRQPGRASTRRTTLWWMCSWRAMVPIVHFSA